MRPKRRSTILLGVILAMSLVFPAVVFAADNAPGQKDDVKVDIPISLKKAKVVFDIGRVTFSGDLPVALRYMTILAQRFKEQKTEGQIVAVFYTGAAYLLLNDQAYNKYRLVSTGNPYKGMIAELMAQGVQIEECAMSMRMQHIRNEDLLKGVKVNGGANPRMVQLMQEGFLRLQP